MGEKNLKNRGGEGKEKREKKKKRRIFWWGEGQGEGWWHR